MAVDSSVEDYGFVVGEDGGGAGPAAVDVVGGGWVDCGL